MMENKNMNKLENNDLENNNLHNTEMKNSNKNLHTTKAIILCVLAIITIFCIFFGTYRFSGNVKKRFINFFNGDEKYIEDFFDSFDDDFDDNLTFENNKIDTTLEAFSNIKINSKVMSVTIKNGDQYHLYCTYNRDKLKPEYKVENNTLIIYQQGIKNNGNIKCNVLITVPRSTQLNTTEIELNVGEIILSGFDCENLKITNNVGEIDIRNINFEDLNAQTNVGEISVNTMLPIDEYKITATTNIGDVKVDGFNARKTYSQKGTTNKSIYLNTNVGEIDID